MFALLFVGTVAPSVDHTIIMAGVASLAILAVVVFVVFVVFVVIKILGRLLVLALRLAIIAGILAVAPSAFHAIQGRLAGASAPTGASRGARHVITGAHTVLDEARAQGLDPAGIRIHIVCGGSTRRVNVSDSDGRLLNGALVGQAFAFPLPPIVTC